MRNLASGNYTHDDIKKILLGNRKVGFRFELQDKYKHKLGDVTATGTINHDSDMTISRVASLTVKELNEINVVDERIQPFFRVHLRDKVIEYPLGVFLISSPTRSYDGYVSSRACECYDQTVILREDKFDSRHLIRSGTAYTTAINTILGNVGFTYTNIASSSLALPKDIEFEIGTSKIDAINSLLDSINYNHLHFDEQGTPTSEPFIEYSLRTIEEHYATDNKSIIGVPVKRKLDTFDFPNKIVRYTDSAETTCLKSVYVNSNPASKLSTFSRQRTIVDIQTVSDIADQTTLDAYVRKIANQNSLYEIVEFETALMPHHTNLNCLGLDIDEIDIAGKYIETSWTMNLELGGSMTHKCKRVVEI